MKRKILTILVLLIIFSCKSNRAKILENQLNGYIINSESENSLLLRLDTISTFDWDALLVAGPYTNLNHIKEYDLKKFPTEYEISDREVFFGFLNNKKGVKWVDLKITKELEQLTFGGKNGYRVYPKTDCVFKLK